MLNNIYCYCLRIGSWKELTPPEVIACKRQGDKLVHLSRPYFSGHFFECYENVLNACFETFQGHGTDAKLKSPVWEHKNVRRDWQDGWDAHFENSPLDEEALKSAYELLLDQVRAELSSREDEGAELY